MKKNKNKNKNDLNITTGTTTLQEQQSITISNNSTAPLTIIPGEQFWVDASGTASPYSDSWQVNYPFPAEKDFSLSDYEVQDIRIGLLEKVIEKKIDMKRYKDLMKVISSPDASTEADDVKIIIEIANS